MGKIIFALLTAAIAWVFFKGLTKKRPGSVRQTDTAESSPGVTKKLDQPERMVKCVQCGVFMPETESFMVDGRISCRDPQLCAHGRT